MPFNVVIAHHRGGLLLAALMSVMLLYPPLYTLWLTGIKTLFAYFAEDTYYYLVVAKNSLPGFFTYDGETPTNGFHPLWQYLLYMVFGWIGRVNLEGQLYGTYVLSMLLTVVGFIFAGLSLRKLTGSNLLPVWLIPGPFYLLFTSTTTIVYTFSPWAFMNGMETPLSICLAGLLLFVMAGRFPRFRDAIATRNVWRQGFRFARGELLVMGCVLGLLTMTRLDDGFLVLSMTVFVGLASPRGRERGVNALMVAGPAACMLGVYFGFNYFSGLTLLPVSGLIKSTPTAAFSGNLETFASDFFPPLHEVVRPDKYNILHWLFTTARTSGMMLPLIFAMCLLASMVRSGRRGERIVPELVWFAPILVYIVLKASYNLVNVRYWNQGYWYYPVSVFFMNYLLILLVWLRLKSHGMLESLPVKAVAGIAFLAIYSFHSAQVVYRGASYDDWPFRVWQHREVLARELARLDPEPKFIDRTDGMFSYALGVPSVAMSGFPIDPDGYTARNEGRLLDYYLRRGFGVTAKGVPSWPLPQGYVYHPVYRHEDSRITLLQIRPRHAPVATEAVALGGSRAKVKQASAKIGADGRLAQTRLCGPGDTPVKTQGQDFPEAPCPDDLLSLPAQKQQ
jgi:hypothetical protein